ncbi:hypothetical protein GRI40_13090 [Altererythrobacter aerius]|uniref:Circularly permuted type 2 ATP-grasp protein n=1 Tax=Tsuneonella aeria TaxID=1837929 RepID=A0A6I4TI30_9SPHN|nr:hypothetical protein [Tsuneonella aeria]
MLPESLNARCFCVSVDRDDLNDALAAASGDVSPATEFATTHPHLFSGVATFLSASLLDRMRSVVQAIERVAAMPAYIEAVLAYAPEIAGKNHGPSGVFMGYDFHLDASGPRLIEINTNAGGAFLNAVLAKVQRRCCGAQDARISPPHGFAAALADMFGREWRSQRVSQPLRRIAITDDRPQEQYLYPEFVIAQEMLRDCGFEALIVDGADFRHADGRLLADGLPVDLVYNRLTDFALEQPAHEALRDAYAAGDVVLTPNPFNHAVHADKRNLVVLSDPERLRHLGADAATINAVSAAIPRTVMVTRDNADELWARRKDLFFKPAKGYGAKGAFRGDKLTRSTWAQILDDDGSIAQAFVPPSTRMMRIDGETVSRKVDVRLYSYRGEPLLVASRIYQGQTTNMRTPGGGFAPVLLIDPPGV